MKLKDMTPQERARVIAEARAALQVELTATAAAIGVVLDDHTDTMTTEGATP
jgi:hypothetical protein